MTRSPDGTQQESTEDYFRAYYQEILIWRTTFLWLQTKHIISDQTVFPIQIDNLQCFWPLRFFQGSVSQKLPSWEAISCYHNVFSCKKKDIFWGVGIHRVSHHRCFYALTGFICWWSDWKKALACTMRWHEQAKGERERERERLRRLTSTQNTWVKLVVDTRFKDEAPDNQLWNRKCQMFYLEQLTISTWLYI